MPNSSNNCGTRLLVGYARAHLGISLGKTCDMLDDTFTLDSAGTHMAISQRRTTDGYVFLGEDGIVIVELRSIQNGRLTHLTSSGL